MKSRRGAIVAIAVGLVAITWWIYAPVAGFDFVSYDDADFVTGNRGINTGFTWESLRYIVHNPYYATGGPLTFLSHIIDLELYGLRAGGHHVTGLVFHILNVLLLFFVLFRMTNALWSSAVVAALFAVHPLHVESVAWVSQRKDVLSTFFWLLALWQYHDYAKTNSRARYVAVLLLCAAGLMSKPIVAMLPLTLLLLDAWPLERLRGRRVWIEKLPFAILAVMSLALTLQSQLARGAVTEHSAPLMLRLSNVTISYAAYLWKLVWPVALSPFYPYRLTFNLVQTSIAAAVLVSITVIALRARRSVPAIPFGWGWYLVTLLPVIGFVQVGAHAMADRLTYVPSIGIFVAVVWAIGAAISRWHLPRALPVAAGLVTIALLGVTARTQVAYWHDGETLWRHAIAVDPSNGRALANLAATIAGLGRAREALPYYREATQLTPGEPKLRNNYGLALAAVGDRTNAIGEFEAAIRLDPAYARAHLNLADQLASSGQFDAALTQYREAIDRDPALGLAKMNLSITLAEIGRLDEAARMAEEAIALEPGRADWRFTAAMMMKITGRRADAIRQLEQVLRLQPGHADARQELAQLRGK